MKRLPLLLLSSLALASLGRLGSTASAETLPPTDDTFSTLTLSAGKTPTVTKDVIAGPSNSLGSLMVAKNHRAFLQFQAADQLAAEGVTSVDISAARLTIYFPSVIKAGVIDLHQVTTSWTEKTKLSQPEPTIGDLIGTAPANLIVAKQFITFDVTGTVRAWLDGTLADNGFALESPDSVAHVTVGAKEGPGSGYPAALEIELTAATTASQNPTFGNVTVNGLLGVGTTTPSKPLDIALGAPAITPGTDSIDSSLGMRLTNTSSDSTGAKPDVVGLGFGGTTTQSAIVSATAGGGTAGLSFYAGGDLVHSKMSLGTDGTLTVPGAAAIDGTTLLAGTVTSLADVQIENGRHLTIGLTPVADAQLTISQAAAISAGTPNTFALEVNAIPGLPFFSKIGLGVDSLGAHLTTFQSMTATVPFSATLPLFINENGGFTYIDPTPNAGSVGIGTTTPFRKLDVTNAIAGVATGTASTSLSLALELTNATAAGSLSTPNVTGIGFGRPNVIQQAIVGGTFGNDFLEFFTAGDLTVPKMSITANVGIGTTNPTKALLEVEGTNATATTFPAYTNYTNGPIFNFQGGASLKLSIFASDSVLATQFLATSDARIKNIEGVTNNEADLLTLRKIEITNYRFKDVIGKGNRPQKKVIAQQVEQVYPQAVSQHTDVVPDIYQKATVQDGWVSLATDLKVGERVRLIGEKEKGIYEVLEVGDGKFRTAFQPATPKIFVFGREVQDFRTVDYEALSMLNLSATQELARQVEAKEAELNQLRATNAALVQKLSALETSDEAREARLSRLESQMNPRGAMISAVVLKAAPAR